MAKTTKNQEVMNDAVDEFEALMAQTEAGTEEEATIEKLLKNEFYVLKHKLQNLTTCAYLIPVLSSGNDNSPMDSFDSAFFGTSIKLEDEASQSRHYKMGGMSAFVKLQGKNFNKIVKAVKNDFSADGSGTLVATEDGMSFVQNIVKNGKTERITLEVRSGARKWCGIKNSKMEKAENNATATASSGFGKVQPRVKA